MFFLVSWHQQVQHNKNPARKQNMLRRLRAIREWLTVKRLILLLLGVSGALVVIGIGSYEFIATTESSRFCGEVCHTPMYPEYTVYQASPHSIVDCSSCHVGAGSYNLITSKARGIPQIYATLTGNYPRPIPSPVENLRPALETCEQCHTPSRFTGFIVQSSMAFGTDEANTGQTNTIVLNVGGGTSGVASGIHSHISARVWYLPLDEERLQIGWVGVEKEGHLKEYVNPSVMGNITPGRIEAEKRLMDCVDCHNRASHIFRSPDELINQAMEEGSIDANLPFIKRESLNAIGSPRPSLEDAYAGIDLIPQFYQDNYPRSYTDNISEINQTVNKLKEISRLTTFPEMRVDWNTHADHSGHNEPPDEWLAGMNITFTDWRTNKSSGCFRCHGTLVPTNTIPSSISVSGAEAQKPMDASCNLCHYSLTGQPGSPIPKVVPHPKEGLENCLLCHDLNGLKPIPADHPWTNNEACVFCHQQAPVPEGLPVTPADLAKNIPHTTEGLEDCLLCHGPASPKPFATDHPWSADDTCGACHESAPILLPLPSAAPPAGDIPAIPHSTRGLEDCLLCHARMSPEPLTAAHPWTTSDTCSVCHQTAATLLPLPAALPSGTIPAIPHSPSGLENCLLCHGRNGPIPFVVTHPWATNETCRSCHTSVSNILPVPPSVNQSPRIPHSIEGLDDCRVCHGESGIIPYPANHTNIPGSFCTLCHTPG